jgi:radical SAM superfamily enzyme YgiQ (UPF0313 family)
MNVLLIYPKFPDTLWSFSYALKFIRKKAAYPPLGLLTVAAMLPDKFHRRLVDLNVDSVTDDDFAWADFAFIGAMAVQRDSAKQIISRCKVMGLKVIAGGPLFTAEPDGFEEVVHLVLDDADLLDLMARAGFDSVFIGIESPNDASLTECQKIQNKNRDLMNDVNILQRAGLRVQGGFIVGFDSDTASTLKQITDFIQKSGIVTAMVGLLQAPPGTRLFDRLKKDNRLQGQTISGDNVDGTTNIDPKIGRDQLMSGSRFIMGHIYSPRYYYRRVKIFLKEFGNSNVGTPMDLQRFFAFFRSSIRLGILGKERFHYWYLMTWTLVRKPRLLPLAVTLAIYGHHFREICEIHIL